MEFNIISSYMQCFCRYACTGSVQTAIGRGLGDSPGRLMGDSTRVLPEWEG